MIRTFFLDENMNKLHIRSANEVSIHILVFAYNDTR